MNEKDLQEFATFFNNEMKESEERLEIEAFKAIRRMFENLQLVGFSEDQAIKIICGFFTGMYQQRGSE